MNRSPLSRISALSWAVLFLLNAAGDGLGLHPCPHHDLAVRDHAGETATPLAGGAHPAHAADSSAPAAPEEHAGGCTCIGTCQTGGGTPLPAHLSVAVRAVLLDDAAAGPLARSAFVFQHPRHFLPYGLAPPASG